MSILTIVNSVKTAVSGLNLKLIKYSPEISIGAGLVLGGLAIGSSIIATLKIDTVLTEREETLEKIENGVIDESLEYTAEDAESDKKKLQMQTAFKIAKLYLPTIIFAGTGAFCILKGFNKMKSRYLGMTALYNSLMLVHKNYRDRVKEKVGEEEELKIYLNEGNMEITNIDEKGKKTVENKSVLLGDTHISQYATVFGPFLPNGKKNVEWDKNRNFNLMFLKARESIANDRLQSRGYVFLNEVLDSIGLPMTTEGALVGWIKGHGDNCIDFNLPLNERQSVKDYLFESLNNHDSFLLDFNVDGTIFDKIGEVNRRVSA